MNKILLSLFIILFFYAGLNFSQIEKYELCESDIANGKIVRKDYYDGSSLWGYINGGADIYLEYGFKKVLTQDIESEFGKIKIDVYEMENPESAFGIFSVNSHGCMEINENMILCKTARHIQYIDGSFYILIMNDNSSSQIQNERQKIFEKFLENKTCSRFDFPSVLQSYELLPFASGIKFIKGILGLQNALSHAEDLFEGIDGYSIYAIAVKEGSAELDILLVNLEREKRSKLLDRVYAAQNIYQKVIDEELILVIIPSINAPEFIIEKYLELF